MGSCKRRRLFGTVVRQFGSIRALPPRGFRAPWSGRTRPMSLTLVDFVVVEPVTAHGYLAPWQYLLVGGFVGATFVDPFASTTEAAAGTLRGCDWSFRAQINIRGYAASRGACVAACCPNR